MKETAQKKTRTHNDSFVLRDVFSIRMLSARNKQPRCQREMKSSLMLYYKIQFSTLRKVKNESIATLTTCKCTMKPYAWRRDARYGNFVVWFFLMFLWLGLQQCYLGYWSVFLSGMCNFLGLCRSRSKLKSRNVGYL